MEAGTSVIHLRPLQPSDEAFVFSTWLTSAGDAWRTRWSREPASSFPLLTAHALAHVPHTFTRAHAADILNRRDTVTRVACLDDDPDTLLGWAAAQPGVVHWVHVKHSMRREGLAGDLLDAVSPGWRTATLKCSFLSHVWPACRDRGVVFDPYAGEERKSNAIPLAG